MVGSERVLGCSRERVGRSHNLMLCVKRIVVRRHRKCTSGGLV